MIRAASIATILAVVIVLLAAPASPTNGRIEQFIMKLPGATNPISADRHAADAWATSGVVGGIPTTRTQCGSTVAAYTGTPATINNAIDACGANQYVLLGAGTFTLSNGVLLDKDNVTLRGSGADSTILDINGITAVSCGLGAGRLFNMCANGLNIGSASVENSATWSSGYAKGTTTIVLSSVTNLTVGHTIWLDQEDDTSDGYPAAGDVWIESWGSGEAYMRPDRGLLEGHIVTSCGTSTPGASCNSTTVTIDPPILMPTFRSGKSPGAWWAHSSTLLVGSGLENLTIDATGTGATIIMMINCTSCWITGVRTIKNETTGSESRGVVLTNADHATIQQNYFYGPQATGLVSIYGFAPTIVANSRIENNIFHASVAPFVTDSASYGNVYAYNVVDNTGLDEDFSQSSIIMHAAGGMDLIEGNNFRNVSADNIHIGHFFMTIFRNHLDGTSRNPSSTETQAALALYAVQRFFNVIGNVVGATNWSSYANGQSPPSHCTSCIYELGWQGTNNNALSTTGNDTNVKRTLFRWGNWDHVTSTNDNGSNDSTGTRFCTGVSSPCTESEVPSGITNFPNSIPGSQSLPVSLYLAAKPAWFGSVAWPPIGPDVSGGNLSTATGGHANKIPARVCYDAATNDAAYPSSSPRVKAGVASSCGVP